MTRTNIGAINIRDSDHHQIGRVSQMLYNGWHQAKFNFQPKTTEYYVKNSFIIKNKLEIIFRFRYTLIYKEIMLNIPESFILRWMKL